MRVILTAGLLASLLALRGAPPEPAVVGTWRLVSYQFHDSAGDVIFPFGPDATGLMMYDRSGQMSAHLTRRGRPLFASNDRARGTDAEVRAAFDGYLGYHGRYTVDAARGRVTHYVEGASYPNLAGRAELRFFTLHANRLTVTTPPFRLGDRELTSTLVWERVP